MIPKEAHSNKKVSKAVVIRGLGGAPDNAHLERVRDEGGAESAEIGVGHVVGHCQHAHLRLPPCLQSNTAHGPRQPWRKETKPYIWIPSILKSIEGWLTGRSDEEAAGGSGWRRTMPRVSSIRGLPEEK
jgi:hypothetical protein